MHSRGGCLSVRGRRGVLSARSSSVSTSPDCGSGCVGTLTTEQNVLCIKVQRAQFSTDATNLTTCAKSRCENIVKPSTFYVENNGLEPMNNNLRGGSRDSRGRPVLSLWYISRIKFTPTPIPDITTTTQKGF